MVGVVQTFEGWLLVVLQIVAVIMLAAPTAPLEMALCTAVAIWVGFVWSSMTSGTSLCPFTPPLAFCRAMRALKPAGDAIAHSLLRYFQPYREIQRCA